MVTKRKLQRHAAVKGSFYGIADVNARVDGGLRHGLKAASQGKTESKKPLSNAGTMWMVALKERGLTAC